MELTLQEKLKLIDFFEFLLDEEISKPLGEMNPAVVDDCIKILLHLQDKHIKLSSEFIDEQVRKIFREEEKTASPEEVKTTKKYFNKKMVWLVAACIAILVALFGIISVANDWDVFDFLTEKFGSVHSTPIGEKQDFNGVSVLVYGTNKNYPSVEDALKTEKADILYPAILPDDIQVINITFCEDTDANAIFFTFTDTRLFMEVYLDKPLNDATKAASTETQEINTLNCYIYEMTDINSYQVNFEYNGDTYVLSHRNKDILVGIIENLEEIKK